MTSGLNTGEPANRRGGPKPNGRATDEGVSRVAKEIAVANPMENLLAQFMNATGPQLRAVFDKAIADHNTRVEEENKRHTENLNAISEGISEAELEIETCQKAIQKLNTKINSLVAHQNEDVAEHQNNLAELDRGRDLIENMMQLFKHKLDGFVE